MCTYSTVFRRGRSKYRIQYAIHYNTCLGYMYYQNTSQYKHNTYNTILKYSTGTNTTEYTHNTLEYRIFSHLGGIHVFHMYREVFKVYYKMIQNPPKSDTKPHCSQAGRVGRVVRGDFLTTRFFVPAVWGARVGVCTKKSRRNIRSGRSPISLIKSHLRAGRGCVGCESTDSPSEAR